jgi:hypothetical protein
LVRPCLRRRGFAGSRRAGDAPAGGEKSRLSGFFFAHAPPTRVTHGLPARSESAPRALARRWPFPRVSSSSSSTSACSSGAASSARAVPPTVLGRRPLGSERAPPAYAISDACRALVTGGASRSDIGNSSAPSSGWCHRLRTPPPISATFSWAMAGPAPRLFARRWCSAFVAASRGPAQTFHSPAQLCAEPSRPMTDCQN